MGDLARIFIGLKPPLESARELARLAASQQQNSDHYRSLAPEALHLTLAFLGDTPAAALPDLLAFLYRHITPPGPLELSLDQWITLPPGPRPRVVALEVCRSPKQLLLLHQEVTNSLREFAKRYPLPQFLPTHGNFLPHLTLARIPGPGPRKGSKLFLADLEHPIKVTFTNISIFRSYLERTGARYESVYEIALGK